MKFRFATFILLCVTLSLLAVLILPFAFSTNHARAQNLFADSCGGTPDTWQATTLTNAPEGRSYASAVWTGTEMLVWGGSGASGFSPYREAGGRYNPTTNTWTAMSTTNQPHPRINHTALWTGTEMIVWGGYYNESGWHYLNDGGRYNPATDTWMPISTVDAPIARAFHSAVWTGSEMIVWGGESGQAALNTGGRYNPATNTWSSTSTLNAPSPRSWLAAVWDGNEMIVWGGQNAGSSFDTGGKYDPWTDAWSPISTTNAPPPRGNVQGVWTGNEMIVWGGQHAESPYELFNIGGKYNPVTDSWVLTPTENAPTGRADGFTLVWAGGEMVVWGGNDGSPTNTGGRYDPATNTWTATLLTDAPSARHWHVAVGTDSEMIVWGGDGGSMNTGGRLFICPTNPSPTPRPTNTHAPTTPTNTRTPSNTPPNTHTATSTPTFTSTSPSTPTPTWTGTVVTNTPTATATDGPSPTPGGDTPVIESFAINAGALTSTTTNVNLIVSYSDPDNDLQDASVSNDGVTWSDWDDADENIGWTLPGGDGVKTVYLRARDAAGHISEIKSDTITLDTTVESEFSVSVNQGALYTNQVGVSLKIGSKTGTSQMQVSNDGGFVGAIWEPYTSTRAWEITEYDGSVIPRTVYVRFKDSGGNVVATASDDIILDVKAPTGSVNIGGNNTAEDIGAVTLNLSASDDLSGVGGMRLSNRSDFQGASWISFASNKSWNFASNQVVFAQFRDNAGNVSKTYATTTCSVKPSTPQLKKPKNGASVNVTQVKLDWSDSKCGTTFSLVVKADSPNGKQVGKLKPASISEFTTKTLARGKTYYWQVKACNVKGCVLGNWWSFKIPK